MKWFAALVAAFLIWIAGVAVWIASGPSENTNDYADAAIVLGAAVDGDAPSPVFAARIDHAIDLLKSGRVQIIIFTGASSIEDTVSESEAARQYAIDAGVPAGFIETESLSRTTHQNLVEADAVMKAVGGRSALIVSDPLHLRRAYTMAQGLGMDAKVSETQSTRYQSWSTKAPFLLREVYFIHHYWIFGE
ncbi:MAG: YdcF family protein [Erythrobacter sp.]